MRISFLRLKFQQNDGENKLRFAILILEALRKGRKILKLLKH